MLSYVELATVASNSARRLELLESELTTVLKLLTTTQDQVLAIANRLTLLEKNWE